MFLKEFFIWTHLIFAKEVCQFRLNGIRQSQRNKVSLPISLKINLSNSSYIFVLDMNFENQNFGLYVIYIFNTDVKFHSNWILFTI